MNTKKIIIAVALLVLPVLFILWYSTWNIATANGSRSSTQYGEVFTANLSGQQEVPQIATSAGGNVVIRMKDDGSGIDYTITLTNIQHVTAAHFHCAPAGANGPVIAPIITTEPRNYTHGSISGSVTEGDLLPHAMNCQPNIQTLAHFAQAMREGSIYVNVHTVQNPQGEIRGQIMNRSTQSRSGYSAHPSMNNSGVGYTAGGAVAVGVPNDMYDEYGSSGTYPAIQNPQTQTDTSIFNDDTINYNAPYGNDVDPHSPVGDPVYDWDAPMPGQSPNNGGGIFDYDNNIDYNAPYGSNVRNGRNINSGYVSSYPNIELSTYYAHAHTPLTIEGSGFARSEHINVMLGGRSIGTVRANAMGEFVIHTRIPAVRADQIVLEVRGLQSNTQLLDYIGLAR